MSERIFEGRVAVVTGGSRGIGRAICQMLADGGARVAINFERNQPAARKTLELIAGQGILAQANLTEEAQVNAMIARVRQQIGAIDFLVNNAGIYSQLPHEQLKFADWKRMLEVNLDGVFLTTWAVKDEMIARRFGRIVNISSIAGLVMKKNMIHYATSKAAVIAFTRSCSEAFAPHNVRVNCLAPGLIDTEMARSADPKLLEQLVAVTPMGRMGTAEEMASVVRFLFSEDSSFMTGQTLVACGGRV